MKSILIVLFIFFCFGAELIAKSGNNASTIINAKPSSLGTISISGDQSILFWETSSTIDSIFPQFFTQKINSYGETVWGKDVAVTIKDTLIRSSHKLVSDGLNGVIITWEQRSINNETTDVYAQRIDSTGKVLWGPTGIKVSGAEGSQITPLIISDNKGGALISWNDSRNDLTNNNWDIYAQHVNSAGEILWEENGIVISADLKDEFLGKLLPAADGGVTVIWNKVVPDIDGREGYDFYFQKISPEGLPLNAFLPTKFLTLPPGDTDYALGGDILSDGKEGFFLSLAISNSETTRSLHLQHILANGQSTYSGDFGIKVDTSSTAQSISSIQTDSLGYLIVNFSNRDTLKPGKKFDEFGNEVDQEISLISIKKAEPLAINLRQLDLVAETDINIIEKSSDLKTKSRGSKRSVSTHPLFNKIAGVTTDELRKTVGTVYFSNSDLPKLIAREKNRLEIAPAKNFYQNLNRGILYRKEEETSI